MGVLRARPKLTAGVVVLVLFASGAAYQALFGARSQAGLHVVGNRLVDRGKVVRLLGVDWSGSEDECARSGKPFGAPTGQAAVAAIARWRINAVRVPLNADCWLDLGGAYRDAVEGFVARLHAAGLYVILALDRPRGRMPGDERGERFWNGVAKAFRDDDRLALDLYGEPHGVDWFCWRDGCKNPDGGPRLAGMQQLVDAVREAGAKQPLLLGGLDGGNDLRLWLDRAPQDPEGQLVASFHTSDRTRCSSERCWSATVAQVAERVPVVTDSLAATGCRPEYVDAFTSWADAHGVSYLVGVWKPGSCESGALIATSDGTPTRYGLALKRHLARLWGRDETLFRVLR